MQNLHFCFRFPIFPYVDLHQIISLPKTGFLLERFISLLQIVTWLMIVKLVAMIAPSDVAPITNCHSKFWKIVFLAHVDLYFCILNKILPLHGWIQAQVYIQKILKQMSEHLCQQAHVHHILAAVITPAGCFLMVNGLATLNCWNLFTAKNKRSWLWSWCPMVGEFFFLALWYFLWLLFVPEKEIRVEG